MLTVYYYYKFKVRLDDVVELMALRGLYFSHQTVHNWVQTFGVDSGMNLCARRKENTGGNKWHILIK